MIKNPLPSPINWVVVSRNRFARRAAKRDHTVVRILGRAGLDVLALSRVVIVVVGLEARTGKGIDALPMDLRHGRRANLDRFMDDAVVREIQEGERGLLRIHGLFRGRFFGRRDGVGVGVFRLNCFLSPG